MSAFLAGLKSIFARQDLTQGKPIKCIFVFLMPILLSTLFQQLYLFTDAIVVGQALQEESVAAINASSSINYMVLNLGIGASSGFSVILSREVGRKNVLEAKRSYLTQIILCACVSLFIAVVGIAFIPLLLNLVNITKGSGDVRMDLEYEEARTYLMFLFGGSLFTVFYNMISANLRAKGDSFAPFMFLVMGVALNLVADLLFVRTFQWGVAGSAAATTLCQGVSCIASMIYGWKKYEELKIDSKEARPTWSGIREHALNGIPLGFQYSILGFGIIAMTNAVVRFDINPNGSLATDLPAQIGYGVGCKVINLLIAPLNSLGAALLSYISQNYGAKRYDRVKEGIKSSLILSVILSVLMNVIGLPLLINGFYQYVFLSADKITDQSIHYGTVYLLLSIPTLFFIGALFVFRNVLQGLEKPIYALLGGIAELISRIFVCSLLPIMIFQTINSSSPDAAYCIVASGDWIAWLAGALIMMIPSIFFTRKLIKSLQNPDISETQEAIESK